MRSFTSALIVAALAALSSAVPVALPDNLPVKAPSVPQPPIKPVSAPLSSRTDLSIGHVSSAESQVKSIANGVRDVDSKITDAVESIQSKIPRASTPSVSAIFTELSDEIQPYAEMLTSLNSSSLTVAVITDLVASIKTPVDNAVTELQALVGADASAIMAPVTGNGSLTVSQIAFIVAIDVNLIFDATDHVLDDHCVSVDVKSVLADLGASASSLVNVVFSLVDGLGSVLDPLLHPSVDDVIDELNLDLDVTP